ncbi:hypothetical protein BABAJAGA_00800 [Brevundimonas phage vB_BgoS-BabaJaga]|nr:hypothetical protein BABAJAGA_00800 [Brevundimonas phage vB_BgoS-BabaJaga]
MLPERIPGANRAHGAPKDWDANERGTINVLQTRDEQDEYSGLNFMVCQWKPTPEELAILNAGGSVRTAVNAVEQHPIIRFPTVVAAGEF